MQIKDSVALVTGANRGVGRAIVEALLRFGVKRVYATARRKDDLAALVALDTTRVTPLALDVTNPAQIAAAATTASDVNLVFNNAGALDFGGILNTPLDVVERNFAVNFYGQLHVARAFSPVLESHGKGAFVNILTLLSMVSMPGLAAYNASKAAAWSLTQSLRADLSKKNISVFAVFPGAIDTDMLRGVEMPKTSPADVAAAILAAIEKDEEDIFPDPMSRQVYANWKLDHKSVERQFASM